MIQIRFKIPYSQTGLFLCLPFLAASNFFSINSHYNFVDEQVFGLFLKEKSYFIHECFAIFGAHDDHAFAKLWRRVIDDRRQIDVGCWIFSVWHRDRRVLQCKFSGCRNVSSKENKRSFIQCVMFFPDTGNVIGTDFIGTDYRIGRDKRSGGIQKFKHSFCRIDADWTLGSLDHQENGEWKLLLLRRRRWTCWRRRNIRCQQRWNQYKA